MAEPESAPLIAPADEHNARLVANVHPANWVDPEPAGRYHLVVVGAGTAGLVSAAGAAGLGARVALVERHLMGGDCLNVGCVPSKAMIRAARAWHDANQAAARFGGPPVAEAAGPAGAGASRGGGDFAAAMERMRRLRADLSPVDGAARFRGLGVDVFFGDGRFVAPDAVEVNGRRLRFRRAVIATGARAAALPIPGLAEAGYLTNETVFWPHRAPPPAGGDRRRTDRLRAGAGLRPLRRRGHPARRRRPDPDQGGPRRRGGGPACAGGRRRPHRTGGQDHPGRARSGGGGKLLHLERARRGLGQPGADGRRRFGSEGRRLADHRRRDPGGGGPGAQRRRARSRRRRRRLHQERRHRRRPLAHLQPPDLRRRRRRLAVPVHPRRRRHGPDRHPERPLLRPQEGERPGHAVGHLHQSRGRPRRALRSRRPRPGRRGRHPHRARSPRSTAPSSTAKPRGSSAST